MSSIQRRLRESENYSQEEIPEALGIIDDHVLKNIENFEEYLGTYEGNILQSVFNNLNSPLKNTQVRAGMCLSKIIQNAPIEALKECTEIISERL